MIETRFYMCDDGHQWRVFREPTSPPAAADETCEFGHPAVTCAHEPFLGGIELTLRPAHRVVDRVKNQIYGQSRYFLVLRDLQSSTELSSVRDYPGDEAVRLLTPLHRLPPVKALTTFRNLHL